LTSGPLALLACCALGMLATSAKGEAPSPFSPTPAQNPSFIRLLAPPGIFDSSVFADYETSGGLAVAYDSYDDPSTIAFDEATKSYDLLVLPAPAIARGIAEGALQALDPELIDRLRHDTSIAARALSHFDKTQSFSLPADWTLLGIVYDAKKVLPRLGRVPAWASIFKPDEQRKILDCGLALPDNADAMFFGAWRALNVDPMKAGDMNLAPGNDLVVRARRTARSFAARDLVGILASGSACIGVATEDVAASARARSAGPADADIQFIAPSEGSAIALDTFAIPKDAHHVAEALALIRFLLRPDIAEENAKASGLRRADDTSSDQQLRIAEPLGAYEGNIGSRVQDLWSKARNFTPPELPPRRPQTNPSGQPVNRLTP